MNSNLDELFVDDDVSDLIDDQDKKDFKDAVEGMKQDRVTKDAFRDEWCERRRKHLTTKSGGAKRKKKQYKSTDGKVLLAWVRGLGGSVLLFLAFCSH